MGDAIVRVVIGRVADAREFGQVVVERGGGVREDGRERRFFVAGRTYESFGFKREEMVAKLDKKVQRYDPFGLARRGGVARRVHEDRRGEE